VSDIDTEVVDSLKVAGCCAAAASRPCRRRAAEQRDELASSQLTELQYVPRCR
jgi:hypothetical protein